MTAQTLSSTTDSGEEPSPEQGAMVPARALPSIEEFDERMAWAPFEGGRRLDWLWAFDIEVSAPDLWPHLSDTSLFNRALGLPHISYREMDGLLHGECRYSGVYHTWKELPWDWVAERSAHSVRVFSKGFVTVSQTSLFLEPLPSGGTRVFWRIALWPRSWLARAALRFAWGSLERRYGAVYTALAEQIKEGAPLLPREPSRLESSADVALSELEETLAARGIAPALAARLARFIREGDYVDLERLRPLELGHRWNIDGMEVARACLHATKAGALELSWDVVCPLCRGVRMSVSNLGELPSPSVCVPCSVRFETSEPHAVEIAFHVHPAIREVERRSYCAAEPAHKTHMVLQMKVEPNGEVRCETALRSGTHRLRLLGRPVEDALVIEVGEDGRGEALIAASSPEVSDLAPCATLLLSNDLDTAQTFVIESLGWARDCLLPGALFNLQDFRDLFVEQTIAEGMHLSVGEQTILFTDIVGSTALYADRGDGEAFGAVQAHFVEIYEDVRSHRGAVVKTIGDSAMAAFQSRRAALEAALAMQARFARERKDTPIRLRISIYSGPCIAVNLNNGIDYFGSTVNIAAKLQRLVGAGAIVFGGRRGEGRTYEGLIDEADLEEMAFDVARTGKVVDVLRYDPWSGDSGE